MNINTGSKFAKFKIKTKNDCYIRTHLQNTKTIKNAQ